MAAHNNYKCPVVIDWEGSRSGLCKVGLPAHGNDLERMPQLVIPPGLVLQTRNMEEPIQTDYLDTHEIAAVVEHIMNELRADGTAHPQFWPVSPFLSDKMKDKIASALFEYDLSPAINFGHAAACNVYSTGRQTGLSVVAGDRFAYAAPVDEGITSKAVKLNLAGRHLTDQLFGKFLENGFPFYSRLGRQIVRDIKEKHVFVPEIPAQHYEGSIEYVLPDGETIQVETAQLAACGERPFVSDPDVFPGTYQQLIYSCVDDCDMETRRKLLQDTGIVPGGGVCATPGFAARLESEINSLIRARDGLYATQCRVNQQEGDDKCRYSVLRGAMILASLSTAWKNAVTLDYYLENGTIIPRSEADVCTAFMYGDSVPAWEYVLPAPNFRAEMPTATEWSGLGLGVMPQRAGAEITASELTLDSDDDRGLGVSVFGEVIAGTSPGAQVAVLDI